MDKKTVLAFLLIFIVIVGQWVLFPPKRQAPRRTPETEMPLIQQDTTRREPAITQEREIRQPEPVQTEEEETSEFSLKRLRETAEEEIIIETPLYTGILSTKGATIKNWTLKEYVKHDNTSLNLINNNVMGNLSLAFLTIEDQMLDFSRLRFVPKNLEKRDGSYFIDIEGS